MEIFKEKETNEFFFPNKWTKKNSNQEIYFFFKFNSSGGWIHEQNRSISMNERGKKANPKWRPKWRPKWKRRARKFFLKKAGKRGREMKSRKAKDFLELFSFFFFFFWKKKITFRCCWQMTRRARSRTFRLGLWRVAPRFTEFYRVFFWRDQRWPFPIFGRSSRRVSMDRERVYRVLRELP